MARLYNCGFEMQSTTDGMEWNTTTGSPTINTTTYRSGNAALRVNPTAEAWYFTHLYQTEGTSNNHYLRFYIRIATATDTAITAIALFRSATSGNLISIRLNTDNTIELWNEQTAAQLGSDSAPLSLNTWYRIELEYRRSASTAHGYIDGVEFATGSAANTFTTSSIRAGSIDASTTDFYIDDIVVNDSTAGGTQTGLPGSGKLSLALPRAAGDSAATTGTYNMINEIPPTDTLASGSTMIELDANPTNGDYRMYGCDMLNINANDTINCIYVLSRMREESAGTSNYTLRIKSAASGTVSSSSSVDVGDGTTVRTNPSGTTNFGRNHISYTDPTTGVAWRPYGANSVENMQVGVGTTDGSPDTRCAWLGAYVDFTPREAATRMENYMAVGVGDGMSTGERVR